MEPNYNKWKLVDPHPESTGVLLSDFIESYVKEFDVLVDRKEFKSENLKPAYYSLTLGREYYMNGKVCELDPADPARNTLEIPPNSYIIATTAEKVRLPHYITGRFGLRVEFVYKGLLVGAGPQVDPGYEGYLGCPVHNLTNTPVVIRVGEPYAWIDFTKTSTFGQDALRNDPRRLVDTAARELRDKHDSVWVIPGHHGFNSRLYVTARKSFKNSLPPGRTVASSVQGLEDRIQAHKTETDARLNEMDRQVVTVVHWGRITELASVVVILVVLATLAAEFLTTRTLALRLEGRVTALETKAMQGSSAPPTSLGKNAVPTDGRRGTCDNPKEDGGKQKTNAPEQ